VIVQSADSNDNVAVILLLHHNIARIMNDVG